MRTIEIEEDIYRFLVQNTQELGESASDVLRRLLHLPTPEQAPASATERRSVEGQGPKDAEDHADAVDEGEREAGNPGEAEAGDPRAKEAEDRGEAKAGDPPEEEAAGRREAEAGVQEKARGGTGATAEDGEERGAGDRKREEPRTRSRKPRARPKKSRVQAKKSEASAKKSEAQEKKSEASASGPLSPTDGRSGEPHLREFLASPVIRKANATGRYLEILGFLARAKPDRFEKVLEMSGRTGRPFARSKRLIEESGKSTHPRKIPDSPYWAMTDMDDFQKRDVLREAMELMHWDAEAIRTCVAAIR